MSGSGGIPLRRPRLGPETLAERILDAIPYDGWVSAAEIAAQVGASSRTVAMLIRQRLLHMYVERRPGFLERPGCYLYRRLARVGGERER